MVAKDSSAFTLLEVMVALSILALVLSAVFSLHSGNFSLFERAETEIKASFLAEKALNEFILQYMKDKVLPDELEGDFDDYESWTWKGSSFSFSESEDLPVELSPSFFYLRIDIFKDGFFILDFESIYEIVL